MWKLLSKCLVAEQISRVLGTSQFFCFFKTFKSKILSVSSRKQWVLIRFDRIPEMNIHSFFISQLENKELRELLSISSESLQVRKESSVDTASQAIK